MEGGRPSSLLGAANSLQGETQAGSAACAAGDGAGALNPTTRTRSTRTRTRTRSIRTRTSSRSRSTRTRSTRTRTRSRSRSRERRARARSRSRSSSKERRQAEEVEALTRSLGWLGVADDESYKGAGWGSSPPTPSTTFGWGGAATRAESGAWGSAAGASWGTESKSAQPESSTGWGSQTDKLAGWGSSQNEEPAAAADDGWGTLTTGDNWWYSYTPRPEGAAGGSDSKNAEPEGDTGWGPTVEELISAQLRAAATLLRVSTADGRQEGAAEGSAAALASENEKPEAREVW